MGDRDMSGVCECLRQLLQQQASELSSMFQSLSSHDSFTSERGYTADTSPFGVRSLPSSDGPSAPLMLMGLMLLLFVVALLMSRGSSSSSSEEVRKPGRRSHQGGGGGGGGGGSNGGADIAM